MATFLGQMLQVVMIKMYLDKPLKVDISGHAHPHCVLSSTAESYSLLCVKTFAVLANRRTASVGRLHPNNAKGQRQTYLCKVHTIA